MWGPVVPACERALVWGPGALSFCSLAEGKVVLKEGG